MKRLNVLSFVPVVLIALTSPALGQNAQAPAAPAPASSYFMGEIGAAVNQDFENLTAMLGAEYGERVHRDVFAYVSYSYLDNLMSQKMRDSLATASVVNGRQYSGRDRGLAFTLGAKFLLPTTSRIRPYFGGGAGILNLKRYVTEATLGDISESFYLATGVNDGVIDANKTSTTNPFAEVIGGVSSELGNGAYVDAKYRYGHMFGTTERIDFSQVSIGLGVTF